MAKLSTKLVEINEKEESSDSDSELSDDEYESALAKLAELRKKEEARESGMKDEITEENKEDMEGDDDLEDAEMKKEAKDFKLYYSPLDTVNELYYVKTKLEEIAKKDMNLYKQLETSINEDEKKKFNEAMVKADEYQKELIKENIK